MDATKEDLLKRIKALELENKDLRDQLNIAIMSKFGKSSEKESPLQGELFEEYTAEEIEEIDREIKVPSYTKKKGRKPINSEIPRKDIIHDIPEEDKHCACGYELVKIDEEVSERLQIIPEQVYVERHIRPKYACRSCEGSGDEDKPTFRIAPAPKSLIPGSIMTGGLLSYILINKFCDALPFYRQEKRFKRFGVPISRQNMSSWTIKSYFALRELNTHIKNKIRSGPFLQMDETTVQVHGEKDKDNSSKSYIWVSKGGPPEFQIALYEYNKSRSQKYISGFVEDYEGFLQSDGYKGYDSVLKASNKITHVGCLAHVRRKLRDAYKAEKGGAKANAIINKIQKIYNAEKELRNKGLLSDEFLVKRKEKVKPLLDDVKKWLDQKASNIRPSSKLGQAVAYGINQWPKVVNYLDCPYLTPDNNAAERVVKPFVIGRKNFLFAGSTDGADAMCFFYTLIETAKLNGINPYAYLRWVFENAPKLDNQGDESIEKLAPWNVSPEIIDKIMDNA